ncbi:histidine phosphatase family protein [Sphingomonas sanguinis]|uniref:histidine phosphatase family protein n=1 Tax=Sphingomonas sanguinis TaxID=33051 RepID=UPI0009EA6457
MKKLTLVRHGVTSHTLTGRFCGHQNPPLHNDGIRASNFLTSHPLLYNVDIVVSSPLSRAFETAKPIANHCSVDLHTDDRLLEIDFGNWDGCVITGINTSSEYDAWRKDPATNAPPMGETGLSAQARAIAASEHYQIENDHIVIVSHKGIIRLLICHYLGLPAREFRSIGPIPASSVSQLILDNRRWHMNTLGDVCHLPIGLMTGSY